MSTKKLTLEELQLAVKTYVEERDWQQFHSPKNLSMAISIEAAELMELFRFMSCQDSKKVVQEEKQKVAFELADISIAVLGFCNLYDIDLGKSIVDKLNHNAQKYPIAKAKGSNKKYHHYQENS